MLPAMRAPLFACLVLWIFGATPVAFRSCGDSSPPDVPLPPSRPDGGTSPVCIADGDCPGFGVCSDVRCLAGSCVLVAAAIDHDRDGEAMIPCGGDCDDADRFVHPGAPEECNGRDDNCDGAIDESAPPTLTNRVVASLDATSSLVRVGDGFVATVGNDARLLDSYGRVGALFDVLGDRVVRRTETATSPDGRALVASVIDDGSAIAFAVLSPGTPPTVSAVVEQRASGTVLDLAVTAYRGSFAAAWTWQDPSGLVHLTIATDVSSPTPSLDLPVDSEFASLASDGTSLAFPERTAELGFLSPTGAHSTRALSHSLLRRGLANGAGFVAALTASEGSSPAYVTSVTSAGGEGPSLPAFAAPEGVWLADETRLALADGRYVATRGSLSDLRIVLFDAALTRTPQELAPVPRSTLTSVSIAALPGLIGALGATPTSSLTTGSDLVLIANCVAP